MGTFQSYSYRLGSACTSPISLNCHRLKRSLLVVSFLDFPLAPLHYWTSSFSFIFQIPSLLEVHLLDLVAQYFSSLWILSLSSSLVSPSNATNTAAIAWCCCIQSSQSSFGVWYPFRFLLWFLDPNSYSPHFHCFGLPTLWFFLQCFYGLFCRIRLPCFIFSQRHHLGPVSHYSTHFYHSLGSYPPFCQVGSPSSVPASTLSFLLVDHLLHLPIHPAISQ